MKNYEQTQQAYNFLVQLKEEIQRQVGHLNAGGDGELQDGFSTLFLEDGWVTLKGCSWGFVLHHDDPVRIDMTFGPDQPFVGHRITFVSRPDTNYRGWANAERETEMFYGPEQLARYGLHRLACKVGDGTLFETVASGMPHAHIASIMQDEMNAPSYYAGREAYE
jgi:hypothetical protein